MDLPKGYRAKHITKITTNHLHNDLTLREQILKDNNKNIMHGQPQSHDLNPRDNLGGRAEKVCVLESLQTSWF